MNIGKFDAKAKERAGLLRLSRAAAQRDRVLQEVVLERTSDPDDWCREAAPEYVEALRLRSVAMTRIERLTRQVRGLEMYLHADDPGHHVHREEPCA